MAIFSKLLSTSNLMTKKGNISPGAPRKKFYKGIAYTFLATMGIITIANTFDTKIDLRYQKSELNEFVIRRCDSLVKVNLLIPF